MGRLKYSLNWEYKYSDKFMEGMQIFSNTKYFEIFVLGCNTNISKYLYWGGNTNISKYLYWAIQIYVEIFVSGIQN